jgi:hypothetical protein
MNNLDGFDPVLPQNFWGFPDLLTKHFWTGAKKNSQVYPIRNVSSTIF